MKPSDTRALPELHTKDTSDVIATVRPEDLRELLLRRQLWEHYARVLDAMKLSHDTMRAQIQARYHLPQDFTIDYDTGHVRPAKPAPGAKSNG